MSTFQPQLVVHADWSASPSKRWLARAELRGGQFVAHAPEPVGDPAALLADVRAQAGDDCVLVGFDFPIGVPARYAERAGIDSFLELLPRLGEGRWSRFYDVAENTREIAIERPFYPRRPGGTSQRDLCDALGVATIDELRRVCERATGDRRAASPLFWTLGAQQVGRAAISGWRDVLAPVVRDQTLDVRVWPFSGPLEALLEPGSVVVAETYPAELYDHLGVRFHTAGKRAQAARAANAAALTGWADRSGVVLESELRAALADGFGPRGDGEDAFDAVVGLLGMLNVVSKRRLPGEPDDLRVRAVEGWMLGQAPPEQPVVSFAPMGWRFSSLDELGEGPGFRKIREPLGVSAFGANAIVIPPGVEGRPHYHEQQDELYFVHRGRARFDLPGEARELGPGGLLHVESTTPRRVTSVGEEELVLLVVGGKGGYVGRDGQLADPAALEPPA